MLEVYVHSHALKHGLSKEQILYVWENYVASQPREVPNEDQILRVGYDRNGSLLQMVGRLSVGGVLIYHAMTPPTSKVIKELGLRRR